MATRLRRTTKYDQPLTEPVRVLFTENQVPKLAELAALSGSSDVSTWLREIALGERQHPNAAPADEPAPGAITINLNEADAAALSGLANSLYIEDPELLAKMIVRRAVTGGELVTRDFLFGPSRTAAPTPLEREVQAELKREETALLNKSKPGEVKRRRKAA